MKRDWLPQPGSGTKPAYYEDFINVPHTEDAVQWFFSLPLADFMESDLVAHCNASKNFEEKLQGVAVILVILIICGVGVKRNSQRKGKACLPLLEIWGDIHYCTQPLLPARPGHRPAAGAFVRVDEANSLRAYELKR